MEKFMNLLRENWETAGKYTFES